MVKGCDANIFFLPKRYLGNILRELRTLVLPDRCMICGAYLRSGIVADPLGSCFCPQCLDLPLPVFTPPYCPCCGHLFEGPDQENHLCENCLAARSDITRVRAAFSYEGLIRPAVALFKYSGRVRLARPLEDHLFNGFDRYFADAGIDLILPVPLHSSRAWERKFNQAVLLVRHFPRIYEQRHGRKPTWKVRPDVMVRQRSTPSQTGLHQKEREKNLKDAFAIRSHALVREKKVLLVDDVYTSGATCRAAAHALLAAGARRVDALVLARA